MEDSEERALNREVYKPQCWLICDVAVQTRSTWWLLRLSWQHLQQHQITMYTEKDGNLPCPDNYIYKRPCSSLDQNVLRNITKDRLHHHPANNHSLLVQTARAKWIGSRSLSASETQITRRESFFDGLLALHWDHLYKCTKKNLIFSIL